MFRLSYAYCSYVASYSDVYTKLYIFSYQVYIVIKGNMSDLGWVYVYIFAIMSDLGRVYVKIVAIMPDWGRVYLAAFSFSDNSDSGFQRPRFGAASLR